MRVAVAFIKAALFTLVGKFEFSLENINKNVSSSNAGTLFFSENSAYLKMNRVP